MNRFKAQFQSHYKTSKKSPKVYQRILFDLKDYGAIAVTKDEKKEIIVHSFRPEQIKKNPDILAIFDSEENHFEEFEFLEVRTKIDLKIKFSQEQLETFISLLYFMPQAIEALTNKFKYDYTIWMKLRVDVYSEVFEETEFLKTILHELLRKDISPNDFLKEVVPREAEIVQEEPEVVQEAPPPSPPKNYILFCKNSGAFHNLTAGMLYQIISEDEEFYRILDDFGVEHEFKKDRFEKVELVQEEPSS